MREGYTTSLFSQGPGETSATSMPTTQKSFVGIKSPPNKVREHSNGKRRSKSRRANKSRYSNYNTIGPQNSERYWNEFDDGSEAGLDDTYAIYVSPEASSGFPGADLFKSLWQKCFHHVSLVRAGSGVPAQDRGSEQDTLLYKDLALDETEDSDDDDGTSTVRPTRSRSPSLQTRGLHQLRRERILHRCCVFAYVLAIFLLVLSGIILVLESDDINQAVGEASVLLVLLSFVAAVVGSGCMIARRARVSGAYRLTILLANAFILVVGILLLVVIANPLR